MAVVVVVEPSLVAVAAIGPFQGSCHLEKGVLCRGMGLFQECGKMELCQSAGLGRPLCLVLWEPEMLGLKLA